MTDRDTFAAAALTGLLANEGDGPSLSSTCQYAYHIADAMLRERGNHIADASKMVKTSGETRKSTGVADACATAAAASMGCDVLVYDETAARLLHERDSISDELGFLQRAVRQLLDGINERHPEKSPREWACQDMALLDRLVPPDHDAAPAARATADRYVRRAAADGDSDRTDKAAPRPSEGTGKTLSKAEIDALRRVVENGRFIDLSDYGRLRSLLVRLRPEWVFDRPQPIKDDLSDRSKPVAPAVTVGGVDRPVSYAETDQNRIFYDTKRDTTQPRNGALSGRETVPDPDSRVWETPCTPQTQATQSHGSVHGEGSVPDSRKWNEPVAWAVVLNAIEAISMNGGATYRVTTSKEEADRIAAHAMAVVPLYEQQPPTLTDAEREFLQRLRDAYEESANQTGYVNAATQAVSRKNAATLRGLLERLGGGR